jgi:Flagellar motor protein
VRGKAPEKDNSERYLLTYADLMNLLLILFIVLYCAATKDVTKGYQVLNGIAKGFNGTSSISSATRSSGSNDTSSRSTAGNATAKATDYSDFFDQLLALLKQKGLLNKVDITDSNSEVIITLKDTVLFEPGKADLGQQSIDLLKSIGSLMNKISFGQLLVEGYTDSDPIHTAQFRDNRELSMMRAYNVTDVIESAGVDQKKVFPLGCGENYPVAPNTTAANKAKNRRVVLVILKRGITYTDGAITNTELVQQYNNLTNTGGAASSKASSAKGKAASQKTSSKGGPSAKGKSPAASKK